jgi:protocatechuate 3,4-dioxygenase beta subunit
MNRIHPISRLRPGKAGRFAWPLCLGALLAVAPAIGRAAENGAVSGRVLDPQGRAVGAARVYLVSYDARGKALLKQARSAPDGSFAFPALKANERPQVVVAVQEGYGGQAAEIGPQGPRSGLEIRLEAAAELTGKVLDPAGKPIAGVNVGVTGGNWGGRFYLADPYAVLSAVTDAAGAFRIRGVPPAADVGLRFTHPRYARWGQYLRMAEQPSLTVRLPRAARITGRVVYEGSRKPASGVRVSCRQAWPEGPSYTAGAEAVTDKSGRYHFDGLLPGKYSVHLMTGDFQEEWTATERWVNRVAEGREAVCDPVILIRGGLVTGTVTDRETGAPLAEARVSANRVVQQMWAPGPGAKTDARGVYRLRVPPGKWRVQAEWREGYLSPWQDGGPQPGSEVTIAEGKKITGLRFSLQPAAEVSGVVVDPENRPDRGATLWAPNTWEQNVRQDGTFTVTGMKPGATATLAVRGSNRALKAWVEVTPRKEPSEPITIRLERCVPASGRVLDEQGRPLKAIAVRAERQMFHGDRSWSQVAMDTTTTDADGRFTLWLLPGAEHDVKASAKGYGEAKLAAVTVKDANTEIGALSLKQADRVITGRVTDLDGKAVAGARIHVWGEGQSEQREEAVSDDAGRYRIENLSPGKVQVNVNHPTYGWDYRNNVETGSTNVEIVLTPQEPPRLPGQRLKPGAAAPEITVAQWLNGQDGKALKALRGQVVLLLFGTPHNPAVEAASEQLAALQRKYGRRGMAIMAIYDASLPAAETAAYVKARGLPYPVAIVPASPQLGWNSDPFKRYGVHSVPSLFLIDRQGTLRAVNPSLGELEAALDKLVSRQAVGSRQ